MSSRPVRALRTLTVLALLAMSTAPLPRGLPRPIEALMAAGLLILTGPVILLAALGVVLTSPGPACFGL